MHTIGACLPSAFEGDWVAAHCSEQDAENTGHNGHIMKESAYPGSIIDSSICNSFFFPP